MKETFGTVSRPMHWQREKNINITSIDRTRRKHLEQRVGALVNGNDNNGNLKSAYIAVPSAEQT